MYRGILVAIDGSEYSAKAARHAAALAKLTGAKLVLFHVTPRMGLPPYYEAMAIGPFQKAAEEDRRARDLWAEELLAQTHEDLGQPDLAVEKLFVASNHPHEAILEAATKHDVDLIVMAPHGTHYVIGGVLVGSETQKVLTHARKSVLVVH